MLKVNIQFVLINIRKLRERDFITQEDMASRLRISQKTYSKLELGRTKLSLDKLFSIATVLGVDVIELLNNSLDKK